jgi:hypothetical protein
VQGAGCRVQVHIVLATGKKWRVDVPSFLMASGTDMANDFGKNYTYTDRCSKCTKCSAYVKSKRK